MTTKTEIQKIEEAIAKKNLQLLEKKEQLKQRLAKRAESINGAILALMSKADQEREKLSTIEKEISEM